MRVLRSTMYPPPGVGPPMTVVFCDRDVNVSLDAAADIQRDGDPVVFTVTEVFAMPDGGIESATEEATERWLAHRRREEDMAMLFYWMGMTIDQKRGHVKPGARLLIKNNQGAPLSVEEISYALAQLAKHPVYSPDVRVETHSRDSGVAVVLDGGVVSVGSLPPSSKGRYYGPS